MAAKPCRRVVRESGILGSSHGQLVNTGWVQWAMLKNTGPDDDLYSGRNIPKIGMYFKLRKNRSAHLFPIIVGNL